MAEVGTEIPPAPVEEAEAEPPVDPKIEAFGRLMEETRRAAVAPQPVEIPFAKSSDLGGEKDWEDLDLVMISRKVRVRYLATAEVARLQYLPDLAHYQEIIEEIMAQAALEDGDEPKDETKPDPQKMASAAENNYRYMAAVAHVSVMDHEQMGKTEECPSCQVVHPVALWSLKQTNRLPVADLELIMGVALKAQSLGFLGPFFEAPTPSTTQPSASTGESTPEESSWEIEPPGI